MKEWRSHLLFLSVTGMMAALFFSRGLLSLCMGVFVVVAFLHKDTKAHFRVFFSSPVLWGMSLLFVLPLISGLWSTDKQEWLSILKIKLPLLLLPLAFAGPFRFSKKKWDLLVFFFIGFVTAGSLWSFFHYAGNIEAVNEAYLRAKIISTPLRDDHIRFSWLVSISVLLCAWLWWKVRLRNRNFALLLIIVATWLIIFLHLLAVRTGLFSFYIMLFVTAAWLFVKKTKRVYAVILLLSLLFLPALAYFIFPSFHNRVSYILYDYEYFKRMHYLPGGNDANRVISLRAAWNILGDNPVTGTGAGDIYMEVKKWDRIHYPGIAEKDILYPCSEWLIYGLMVGWIGLLLFSIVMLIPFFINRKPRLIWILLNLTAAFGFLFDIGLEVQFGVFIYSFIVLWWWKWLEPQKEITLGSD